MRGRHFQLRDRSNAARVTRMLRILCLISALILVGCVSNSRPGRSSVFEVREASSEPRPAWTEMPRGAGSETLFVSDEALLRASDVAEAEAKLGPNGWEIEVVLTGDAAVRFADATEALFGEALAILIEGEIVAAPVVQGRIQSGRFIVTGNLDQDTAERVASALSR